VRKQKAKLSSAAITLFRLHAEQRRTIDIEANRETYRELARAGLMVAGHSFAGGDESIYRLTQEGFERKAARGGSFYHGAGTVSGCVQCL
jgi:hypothetical protein